MRDGVGLSHTSDVLQLGQTIEVNTAKVHCTVYMVTRQTFTTAVYYNYIAGSFYRSSGSSSVV